MTPDNFGQYLFCLRKLSELSPRVSERRAQAEMIGETLHRRLEFLDGTLGVRAAATVFEKQIRTGFRNLRVIGTKAVPGESSLLRLGNAEAVRGKHDSVACNRQPARVTQQRRGNPIPAL